MRRTIYIVSILLLLALSTSCDFALNVFSKDRDYGFQNKTEIKEDNDGDGVYKFLITTDMHFGRMKTDSSVSIETDKFIEFYNRNNWQWDAWFILGDTFDTFQKSDIEEAFRFFNQLQPKRPQAIMVAGNHDLTGGTIKEFNSVFKDYGEEELLKKLFIDFSDTGSYSIGTDVSIYNLNSAYRTFGYYQLEAFEKAMMKDESKFKMILSHIPLMCERFDQSIFNFILASSSERNRVYRIMKEASGKSFVLSGHHHKGNMLNGDNEFIAAAFHKKESALDLESDGFFYIMTLDLNKKILGIEAYSSFTAERMEEWDERLSF